MLMVKVGPLLMRSLSPLLLPKPRFHFYPQPIYLVHTSKRNPTSSSSLRPLVLKLENSYLKSQRTHSMDSSCLSSQFTVTRLPRSENGRNPKKSFSRFVRLQRDSTKNKSLSTKMCLPSGYGGLGQSLHGVGDKDGVIIVDHGSRRNESNLMLNKFVDGFRERTGYPIVEPAHMELAEPSIRDAFSSCIQQGANRVIVSPFFLFPGRHWHPDIPSLTAEAAKEHPHVSYIITAPLGMHELIVDVVNDNIKHCLSHVAGDADECEACAGTGKCKFY